MATRCACGAVVPKGRRRHCSPACATAAHRAGAARRWQATAARTSTRRRVDWRTQPGADTLIAAVRDRAAHGEPCWFHGRPGHHACPGPIDLRLDGRRNPWAFTVHHLARLMDGGPLVPHPALAAPAHRACNARDGLLTQNQRRNGSPIVTTRGDSAGMTHRDMGVPPVGRTSEPW